MVEYNENIKGFAACGRAAQSGIISRPRRLHGVLCHLRLFTNRAMIARMNVSMAYSSPCETYVSIRITPSREVTKPPNGKSHQHYTGFDTI